jgi:hypothetical protein
MGYEAELFEGSCKANPPIKLDRKVNALLSAGLTDLLIVTLHTSIGPEPALTLFAEVINRKTVIKVDIAESITKLLFRMWVSSIWVFVDRLLRPFYRISLHIAIIIVHAVIHKMPVLQV